MPNVSHMDAGFGIEIECYLPEGASQANAAAAVAHRIGAPCIVETYNHHVRGHWKVVTDGSLGDYARGVEFVSPVLRGEAGLTQAMNVCRALADFGCTVNKRCGLHVHVGVGMPALSFFKKLVRLYAVFEPVIDGLLSASRRASANMFCRSMTSASVAAINAATGLGDLINVVTSARIGERRYFKLNLDAYARHRTVEFRQHSGTLDADKVRMWTLLCLRMVAAAKRDDLNLLSVPTQSVNRARPGTKAFQIGQMFLRPEGVTGREVMAAMNWPSVSMPNQARQCGIDFTTQRTGREIRYFARVAAAPVTAQVGPITVDGFAQAIGADVAEVEYMRTRTANLAGPIAWAA